MDFDDEFYGDYIETYEFVTSHDKEIRKYLQDNKKNIEEISYTIMHGEDFTEEYGFIGN